MPTETLLRAVDDLAVKGRTIEGVAVVYNRWATVKDPGKPSFEEAHAPSSFVETLRRDPSPRPLFSSHDWALSDPTSDPIGIVHFEQTPTQLVYRAFLSRTRKSDEQLALIRDGAKRSVSVAYDPLNSHAVRRPKSATNANGIGQLRIESRLRELSVVPTGFGQYPEARVTVMRSRGTTAPAAPPRTLADIERDRLTRLRQNRAIDWRLVECGQLLRSDFDCRWADFDIEFP